MTEAEHAPAPARQSRGRAIGVWVVLVLAGLFLLLSSFAVWIDRVALNTSEFTETSSTLLADDAIRSAIATRAIDELFDSVDVQAEVEAQLPKDYKSLSGPATAGLRQASYAILDRALEQPRLQSLFAVTLRESHRTLVQVLEGGGPRVSTSGGQVTLDLGSIIDEAASRIGLGAQISDKIPAETGRIVILRSDELDTAQDAFQLLKTLAWFLPLITLATFGAAVLLARDRRRAVRGIGTVVVVVGVLGLLAANLTRNYLVNSLVERRDDREAANNAWDILTELMRGSFRFMIVVGILFVAAAWLAGPGRRAVAARRTLAPALSARVWPYVALGIVVLLLLVTTDVMDFSRFLVLLVLAALGVAWIELLRHQTAVEFPDAAGAAYIADARGRLSGWWDEQRRARAERGTRAVTPVEDVTASLARLADLHSQGALTDEEFAAAKARLLSGS